MAATGRMTAVAAVAPPTSSSRSSSFGGNLCSHQTRPHCIQTFARRRDESSTSVATKEPRESSSSNRVSKAAEQTLRMPSTFIAALSSAGAIETAYLTWIKLTGGSPACPASGPGCNDVLTSEYSTLFGIPLSLIGFIAYSSVALIGFTMLQKSSESFEEEIRWLLLGCTTAMATASGFFIYLLNTKLNGASCTYCIASALISLSLCLSTLKGFKWKDTPQVAGVQVGVIAAVILTLSSAFAGTNSALAELDLLDLPPVEPEITTTSDATKMSLAKYLKSIGAKMYGAFWCSHCHEQKQMLGQEAMKLVDYVECYPEGYGKYARMAKVCRDAKIEGFPTWIIKDQTLPGELSLEELAKFSGFTLPK